MMSARRPAADQDSTPRLYLITPRVENPATFAPMLAAALEAAGVAAALLRLADADEATLVERVRALAPIVQDRGVALVLDGRAAIVARSGADGAHLDGIETFGAAIGGLKPDRIAGAGGLETRHDAMHAAERGADYVLFGDPAAGGRRPALAAIVERVAWWAELFEIPCAGWAASLDEVDALVAAGADFIAIGDFVWADPGGPAAAVAAAAARLKVRELVR